jgi:DNA polymerase III epsilon subunit-like protein
VTVFVAIDTKTSSTLADSRLIEIGIVRLELVLRDGNVQGDVLDVWETLVNPGADKITPAAQGIHGITKRKLTSEPEFGEIVEAITTKLDGDVLVFHDSSLDKDRIASEYAKLGHTVPRGNNRIVDTKKLAETVGLATNINDLASDLNVTGETKRALPTARLIGTVLTGLIRDHGIDLESLQNPRTKLTKLELQIISVEREEAWALAAKRKFSPAQTRYLDQLRKRQAEIS